MNPVWCVRCKIAWRVALLEGDPGLLSSSRKVVRCPACACGRSVQRIADEEKFRAERPAVIWR